jgi:RND family efflux transporter MFP subunit
MYNPDPHPHLSGLRKLGVIIAVIAIIAAVVGIGMRLAHHAELVKEAKKNAVPDVLVIKATEGPQVQEVVLPGHVSAFADAPVYARTSGYLKRWLVDIGAQVKAGDVLAEIDTPDVDDQLRQAEADLAVAEANSKIAQVTARRWRELLKTDSVSKQDADTRTASATANTAQVASAQANMGRLQQLEGFKRVVAPFDGVITARNTDIGQLINAGNNAGQALFNIADSSKLRIYVEVPQLYSPGIKVGMQAELHFAEHPNESFPAELTQMANALDPTTRTLQTQFQIDNSSGRLLPGGYTEVHLQVPSPSNGVRLPVNTLMFRPSGIFVAAVDEAGTVTIKPVKTGLDFGSQLEIKDGVAAGDTVIINPPDSITTGTKVNAKPAPPPKDDKAAPKEEKPAETKPEEAKPVDQPKAEEPKPEEKK